MKKLCYISLLIIGFANTVKGQLTILLNFNYTNGALPQGDLYFDGTYLYGATGDGGAFSYGTVFKIASDGTGYTKLYDFDIPNGTGPDGSLIYDGSYLYGTTGEGGAYNKGAVFKIQPNGTSYAELLDFSNATGSTPNNSLVFDGTYLYGTTIEGVQAQTAIRWGVALYLK